MSLKLKPRSFVESQCVEYQLKSRNSFVLVTVSLIEGFVCCPTDSLKMKPTFVDVMSVLTKLVFVAVTAHSRDYQLVGHVLSLEQHENPN